MRISDWSSDVCSSDLAARPERRNAALVRHLGQRVGLVHELRKLRRAKEFTYRGDRGLGVDQVVRHHRRQVEIGRAKGRERVCQYVKIPVVAVTLRKKNYE